MLKKLKCGLSIKKSICLVFVVFSVSFINLPMSFSDTSTNMKVGFVDLNRVAEDSKRGMALMENFKNEGLERQREIDRMKKTVESMEEELAKQGMLLSDEVRKQKETDVRKEKRELERFFNDSTEEFERKKVQSEQALLGEIVRTTKMVGSELGYTMILSKQFLLYAVDDDGVDLTTKVIKKIDEN